MQSNTQRVLDLLKATALGALALLLVAGAVLLAVSTVAVHHADSQISGIGARTNKLLDTAQTDAVLIGKFTNDGRLTLDNVNKGALDERFYFEKQLPPMMLELHGTLFDLHRTTTLFPGLVTTTQTQVAAFSPLLDHTDKLLRDVDRTANDSNIAATLANAEAASDNLRQASMNVSDASKNADVASADMRDKVHSITHPHPFRAIGEWFSKHVLRKR